MRPLGVLLFLHESGFAGSGFLNGGFLTSLIGGTVTLGARGLARATGSAAGSGCDVRRASVRDGTTTAGSLSRKLNMLPKDGRFITNEPSEVRVHPQAATSTAIVIAVTVARPARIRPDIPFPPAGLPAGRCRKDSRQPMWRLKGRNWT
jgi:hypothetical protein